MIHEDVILLIKINICEYLRIINKLKLHQIVCQKFIDKISQFVLAIPRSDTGGERSPVTLVHAQLVELLYTLSADRIKGP